MLVTCLYCKTQFEKRNADVRRSPRHFCSRSCATSQNNLGKCRNKKKSKADKSRPDFKLKTVGEYRMKLSVKGKHPSWIHSQVRDFARTWNHNLRRLSCQVCGYAAHVELAHIKAISSFRDETTLGEINRPSNILVLCPNHHWEFDNNVLSLSQIPSRKKSD